MVGQNGQELVSTWNQIRVISSYEAELLCPSVRVCTIRASFMRSNPPNVLYLL